MSAKTKTPTSLTESLEIIEALRDENQLLNQKYSNLLEQFKLSRQRQFGSKSESHVDQLQLFDEAEAHANEEPESAELTETITYERKKPTRKPLPKDLPREQVIHDVDDSEKQCDCGCEKQRIGEEISEQLEVIPASVKVIQHVRPKYACNRCDSGVSIATMPTLFLPKSIASPSLVAHIIVNKYQDHLPLYRQEKIWQRAQVDIPRNTMCGWIMRAYEKCLPLKNVLIQGLLSSDYLQVDETTLQVMNEIGKKNTSKSYMWLVCRRRQKRYKGKSSEESESCSKDDGRPVKVGRQGQALNHLKRRVLRVLVVSVKEKLALASRCGIERRITLNHC